MLQSVKIFHNSRSDIPFCARNVHVERHHNRVSQGCSLSDHPHTMTVNQGDRVNLRGDDQKSVDNDTYQVIGVDEI